MSALGVEKLERSLHLDRSPEGRYEKGTAGKDRNRIATDSSVYVVSFGAVSAIRYLSV